MSSALQHHKVGQFPQNDCWTFQSLQKFLSTSFLVHSWLSYHKIWLITLPKKLYITYKCHVCFISTTPSRVDLVAINQLSGRRTKLKAPITVKLFNFFRCIISSFSSYIHTDSASWKWYNFVNTVKSFCLRGKIYRITPGISQSPWKLIKVENSTRFIKKASFSANHYQPLTQIGFEKIVFHQHRRTKVTKKPKTFQLSLIIVKPISSSFCPNRSCCCLPYNIKFKF